MTETSSSKSSLLFVIQLLTQPIVFQINVHEREIYERERIIYIIYIYIYEKKGMRERERKQRES